MLRIKPSMSVCLENYLTREDSNKLIRKHNMNTLEDLCRQYNFPPSSFVLKDNFSLRDIYATKSDWESFLEKSDAFSDPSSNALSHYLNPKNSRVSTNSVFFVDSTSGISLLNPRFVYLVKKLNSSLRKKFSDIHSKISVSSTPADAADIENYYTESFLNPTFYLIVGFKNGDSEKSKQITILSDKSSFLNNLRKELKEKEDTTKLDVGNLKKDMLKVDLSKCQDSISGIEKYKSQIDPYIDQIDDLMKDRKVFNKKVLEILGDLLPEDLLQKTVTLIKTGILDIGRKIYISDKPILKVKLSDILQNKLDELIEKEKDLQHKISGDTEEKPDSSFSKEFSSYVDFIAEEIGNIYSFVTKEPFNRKGSIPSSILTEYRNKQVLLFVLSPDSDDQHRVMGIRPFKDDRGKIKYNFNAAGTKNDKYEIKNGHLVVTVH